MIEDYLYYKRMECGVKESTLDSYKRILERVVTKMGKSAETLTKAQLLEYLDTTFHNDRTFNSHLIVLKDYLAWHKKHHLENMKLRDVQPKDYTVREQDVQWMLESCWNPRDKAMVITLATYGFRESEAASIKMSGVVFTKDGVELTCTESKTKIRTVLGLGVDKLFRDWLAIHPAPKNPDAPFLCCYLQHKGEALSGEEIRRYFHKIERRAKALHPEMHHVHPHALRHFATTQESLQGVSETSIKLRRGWTKNSSMLGRYLHVTNQQANDDYRRQTLGEEDTTPKAVAERKCPKCAQKNPPFSTYCNFCGSPMTIAVAEQVEAKQAGIENTIKLMVEKLLKERLGKA